MALSRRALAITVVALVGATVAVGVAMGATSGAVADATEPTDAGQTWPGSATQQVPADATVAERLACTNATSEAVIACGPTEGPAAVSLAEASAAPGTVTVEAVDSNAGGFVAVHRVEFVDGAFTESVVGVSGYLSSGLHRDVTVDVDPTAANETRLIAVVYRDSDGDGEFDFVATDGATDRPYTNTYTEAGGNVTDEPGDVIGDVERVDVESVVPERAFSAVAGDDGTLDRSEVIAAVRDYMNDRPTDGVTLTRQEILELVRYYAGHA